MYDVIVVVVVFTLTHRYNAVRGHRTGSNNSGAEDYLGGKQNKINQHQQSKTEDSTQGEYAYFSLARSATEAVSCN